jgi:hypothetical protein
MPLIINFRTPDPYVQEDDGTRKPLSEYPDLKVVRTDEHHPEPIVGLREVNFQTGWLTLRAPAVKSPWRMNPDTRPQFPGEWEESCTNISIYGIAKDSEGRPTEICITGIDMRLAVRREAPRLAQKPQLAPPRKSGNLDKSIGAIGSEVVRTTRMSSRPAAQPSTVPDAPPAPDSAAPATSDSAAPAGEDDDWLDNLSRLGG